MSRKKRQKTSKRGVKQKQNQETVVISVRVPEFMSFMLKLYAKEQSLKSAADVLNFWVDGYCMTELAILKKASGQPLTELEKKIITRLEEESNSGRIEEFANTRIELEERGIISDAQHPLKIKAKTNPLKLQPGN